MGSKGAQTIPTQQTQTYMPAPYAQQAITNALGQAYNVAQTPFQTPVAPVAGFSPQQQQAFNITGQAQGMALPYINQAAGYFTPQGIQQFANPFIGSVSANLSDLFGQQMAQTTGNAVAQAGGTGADRIAVAQSELAKQQGLAAGQTYANLYGQAAQQAQTAGFGLGNLGPTAQNSVLQGAQALLGTGGLQQQLAQAQMNAPYQNILQQIAWPYQNAQFLAGITGALAPGLGGTTTGAGQTAYPGASPWGTIAGLGMAGLGVYGLGNQQGWWGGGNGSGTTGTPPPAEGVGSYSARGGRVNPFARGGDAPDEPMIEDAPSLVPAEQLVPIAPHIPQLDLRPPQQSSGGGKGSGLSDIASIAGSVAKIAPLLMAAKRGGRVRNPFMQDGGDVGGDDAPLQPFTFSKEDPRYAAGVELLRQKMAPAPAAPAIDRTDVQLDADALGLGQPYQPSNAAIRADAGLPSLITQGVSTPPTQGAAAPSRALGFAPSAATAAAAAPTADTDTTLPPRSSPSSAGTGMRNMLGSPWGALLLSGLGTLAAAGQRDARGLPLPPLAAIGQGTLAGITQEQSIEQAAQKLSIAAEQHRKAMATPVPIGQEVDAWGNKTTVYGQYNPQTGQLDRVAAPTGEDNATPDVIKGLAQRIATYQQPPITGYAASRKAGAQVMDQVYQINPDYRADLYGMRSSAVKSFGAGPKGDMIRSFDVATQHLGLLQGLVTALDNNDVQGVNRLRNLWREQTGQEAPSNFEAARGIVADEIVKAVVGGHGALGDREAAAATLSKSMSPAQLNGVIDTYKGLMAGQLVGLRKQYEDTTGLKNFEDRLSEDTKREILRHGTGAAPAGAAGASGAARPSAADRYRQLTSDGGMTQEQAFTQMKQEGY